MRWRSLIHEAWTGHTTRDVLLIETTRYTIAENVKLTVLTRWVLYVGAVNVGDGERLVYCCVSSDQQKSKQGHKLDKHQTRRIISM